MPLTVGNAPAAVFLAVTAWLTAQLERRKIKNLTEKVKTEGEKLISKFSLDAFLNVLTKEPYYFAVYFIYFFALVSLFRAFVRALYLLVTQSAKDPLADYLQSSKDTIVVIAIPSLCPKSPVITVK